MKKVLVSILCIVFFAAVLVGCAGNGTTTPSASDAQGAEDQSKAPQTEQSGESKEPDGTKKDIKVGFSIRTMDGSYYASIADSVKSLSEDEGWECVVLNAEDDIAKETENMQTLVSMGTDLIFLDCVDPTAAVASIKLATDANIGVINLDSGVDEGSAQITTVYSDNIQNGRMVGLKFAEYFNENYGADTEIKSILLSGNKGSIAGEQRRRGLMAGIIEGRTGVSEEEAWKAAETLDGQVIGSGKGSNDDAKFTIVGQGWGNWTENGGLEAAEDILTANTDTNMIMGENDSMVLGAIAAVKNAGKTCGQGGDITLIAAADGSLSGYDAIKEGAFFAMGENSPRKIAELGMKIAKEILVDGKDPKSFDEITMTEAICVTKDNVEEAYPYGF